MILKTCFIQVVSLFLIWTSLAWGARVGVVDSREAEVRESPNSNSKILEKIRKNEEVAASNFPVEGFHKVRTATGTIGWIEAGSLILQPTPSAEDGDPDAAQSTARKEPLKRVKEDKVEKHTIRFRGFGGLDFFNLTGVITNFEVSQGLYYGAEITVLFTPGFGLVLRGERIVKSLALTDASTTLTYQVDFNSLPVMGGVEFGILGEKFSVHFAAMGGLGIGTLMSARGSDSSLAVAAANPMTFLGKFDLTWQVTRSFGMFAEGGYRYLVTPTLVPQGSSGIILSSFALNFSGPFAGAGLSLGF